MSERFETEPPTTAGRAARVNVRNITPDEKRLQEFLARVERHILSRPPEGEVFEASPMLGDVLALYSRCRSMYMVIRRLVRAGLAEDGQIIGRSLFESSLPLEYIAAQDDLSREALLIQRRLDGVLKAEHLFGPHASRLKGEGLSAEEAERLARMRRQLLSRQKRLGIKRLRKFPSEGDMAR